MCPVGNFHLRNGARVGRLNWMADPSKRGHNQSGGMMVNYLYELEHLPDNRRAYGSGDVAATDSVRSLL